MPVIRELYCDFPMLPFERARGFLKDGVRKRQKELLIYSHAVAELLPPRPVQGTLFS